MSRVLKKFRNYFDILAGVARGRVWVIAGEPAPNTGLSLVQSDHVTRILASHWSRIHITPAPNKTKVIGIILEAHYAHNCSTFGCKFLPVTQSPHQAQIERLNVTILWK